MINNITTHVVRRGETLTSISRHYATTIDDIISLNKLEDRNRLNVGQAINIPRSRKRSGVAGKKTSAPAIGQAKTDEKTISLEDDGISVVVTRLLHEVMDALLLRFREKEAEERVQQVEKIPVTKQSSPPIAPSEISQKKGSKGSQSTQNVKEKIREQLGKEPHIVTFAGVKLTDNEKKQIMATVAMCEMNSDGFGSVNADYEFVGRRFGNKGIATSYSGVVHIGLSYGVIQYTQDGGELGNALVKMREKNNGKFIEIFGGGDKQISDDLIALTTTGKKNLPSDIPLSGLSHWQAIKKKPLGKELSKLAAQDEDKDGKSDLPQSKEIRGKRVQPISAKLGDAPTDLWVGIWKQRFLEAGRVTDFQEAQINYAVQRYFNSILKIAKSYNVRTAIVLAFMAACSVRGAKIRLIIDVAEELKIKTPFENGLDEQKCIEAIANGNGKVGNVTFDRDESRRAKKLILDELGFLSEDLYDPSSY